MTGFRNIPSLPAGLRIGDASIAAADAASATDDAFIVGATTPITGNLFADNGFGADPAGALQVALVNGEAVVIGDTIVLPSGARLTIGADGAFAYDPNGTLSPGDPTDSFTYATLLGPATVNLFDLDGSDGVRIDGARAGDQSGASVAAAGDVNGDGIDDVIIGAPGANAGGSFGSAGASYVVYGTTAGIPADLHLAALDPGDGFRIDGIDLGDRSGSSVAGAGDVNGDGIDDLIVGASLGDANGYNAGEAYVVFGTAAPRTALDLADLDGSNGFRLDATNYDFPFAADIQVSGAGDFNGDGFDDVIVGTPYALDEGASYIVFGGDGVPADIDLATLDGSDGFRILGIRRTEQLGYSVSGAGDVNGDGFDDVVIGTYPYGIKSGVDYPQYSYVVFGAASGFLKSLAVGRLDGSNGFRIDSDPTVGDAGRSVSGAGDVNGDGFGDIVINTVNSSPDGVIGAGASYVVFGSGAGFDASIALSALDGSNGFRIDGPSPFANVGNSVSAAGDVNGDGFDDVVLISDIPGPETGEAYVVYGASSGFDATLDLATLDPSEGFFVEGGIAQGEFAFLTASEAGDVNVDGYDDILFGVTGTGTNSQPLAGRTFVVYGGPSVGEPGLSDPATVILTLSQTGNGPDTLTGTGADEVLNGLGGNDLIDGAGGNDVVRGSAGDDLLSGGVGDDRLNGGGGADQLFGGDGHDGLIGSAGDDVLSGGAGGDFLRGGAGTDLYVVARSDGPAVDIISDFEDGAEVVQLIDLSVTGVRDNAFSGNPSQATVTLDDGSEVVFRGLLAGDITAADFTFVGSGGFLL